MKDKILEYISKRKIKFSYIDILYLTIVVVGIFLDQLTKHIARTNTIEYSTISIIPKFFYFTYVNNTGGAWSILSGNIIMFIFFSIVAVIVLSFMYFITKSKFYRLALVFIFIGAAGNLIDRAVFQKVTDFIGVYIFSYSFPIFNVADIFVVSGFIGIMIYYIFLEKRFKEKIEANENNETNTKS